MHGRRQERVRAETAMAQLRKKRAENGVSRLHQTKTENNREADEQL